MLRVNSGTFLIIMVARIVLCLLLCIATTCWAVSCSGGAIVTSNGCLWEGNWTVPAGEFQGFFSNCFDKSKDITWVYGIAGEEPLIKYDINLGFADCGSWSWNNNVDLSFAGEGYKGDQIKFTGIGSPGVQLSCDNWIDDCHFTGSFQLDVWN